MTGNVKRSYRYVGKKDYRTRWRPLLAGEPLSHPSKRTAKRLGDGYSVQIRTAPSVAVQSVVIEVEARK